MSRGPELRGRAARLARLLPAGPSRAARTPFVLLMTLLLGGGLITLLMLNSSLNEGSFRLSELKRETTELTDREQALQRDVDAYSKPGALQERARRLGMVPGGNPAFLDPDGRVRGVPGEPVTASPTPKPAPTTAKPSATASPSGTPSAPSTRADQSGQAARSTGPASSSPPPVPFPSERAAAPAASAPGAATATASGAALWAPLPSAPRTAGLPAVPSPDPTTSGR
ncbi:septum formation initiator family protein [Streptomyces sp. JNUCC 64]